MKKRIAILISHPIQYFTPLFRELAKTGSIDLTVFFCSAKGLQPYLDKQFEETVQWDIPLTEGYQFRFLKNSSRNPQSKRFFSLVNFGIYKEIKRGDFDIIWIFGHAYFTMIFALFVAKIFKVKVACYGDSNLIKLKNRNAFKIRFLRRPVYILFYRLYNFFFVIGTRNKEYYLYHKVPENKMYLVPFAVNNSFFLERNKNCKNNKTEILQSVGFPINKKIILTASKFTKGKRIIDLVKAYELIRNEFTNVLLVLVGEGPEGKSLRDYVNSRGIKGVHFMGFKNQTEMPKFYCVADIYCAPGENESWGLAINEAMCFGNPIIATAEIGAIPDLVYENVNGFSYRTGDIRKLANLIKILLSDEEKRVEMGKKSLDFIANWGFQEDIEGIQKAIYAG